MTSIKIILCFIFLFFFFLLILLLVVHSSHSHPLSSDHQTLSNSLKLSRTLSNSHLFVSLPPMRVKTQRHRPPKLNVTDPRADPFRQTPKSTQAPSHWSMPATHANPTRLSNALTHQLCLSSLKSDSPSPKLFLLIKWVFSIFFIYMLGIFDFI